MAVNKADILKGLSPWATGQEGVVNKTGFLDTWSQITTYKPVARDLLLKGMSKGAWILDAGCGSGVDLPELAKAIGPSGKIVGLDKDWNLVHQAGLRVNDSGFTNISLVQGDIYQLPYGKESFDGIRVDRVLQHIEDPKDAVKILVRLLKTGSRIVISEPRWSALHIGLEDEVSRTFESFKRGINIRNGWIMEQLPDLLRVNGIHDIYTRDVVDNIQGLNAFKKAFYVEKQLASMIDMGALTPEQANTWMEDLTRIPDEQFHVSYTTGIIVANKV